MAVSKSFVRRILFLGLLTGVVIGLLAWRLADLQLGDVEANRQRADDNAALVTESVRKDRLK